MNPCFIENRLIELIQHPKNIKKIILKIFDFLYNLIMLIDKN